MRIGVIGVGRMGVVHAETLVAQRDVEVVVTDADLGRAREVAEKIGADLAPAVPQLLTRVDGVVVAAATDAHAALVHAAADAGVPTFCEKPISLDLDSTADVVAHVRDSRIRFQMGFQRRFDAGYVAARELVRTGGLGTLYVVRMAGHDPAPPPPEYIAVSGGIFRDFSIHDFDALRFVTGQEVVEVFAEGAVLGFPIFEQYGDVDSAVATIRLSGGALGILSVTRHDPLGYDVRMELFGSGDSVSVGVDDRTPLRYLEPGSPPAPREAYSDFRSRFREAYRAEMQCFLEVAAGRRESPSTAEDALQALRIAIACDRSRAEHRPVRLEEVG